ncbi:MAG: hypothetical protein QF632_00895 [Candidatus Woesearchaeota archaeon]|nr:hypothetical protein [Candidatus Woesearchaeota archaeon]MDP7323298.1 hypothetical protein [Candidatus Woesearchaeota archaeon]MDP7457661.1 hypothetical protein [Candidatus Woesearchaeota archaeon]
MRLRNFVIGLGIALLIVSYGYWVGVHNPPMKIVNKYEIDSEEMIQQLQKDFEDNRLVTFSRMVFKDVARGTEHLFFYGIKNNNSDRNVCMAVEFVCASSNINECPKYGSFSDVDLNPSKKNKYYAGWNWFTTRQGYHIQPQDSVITNAYLLAHDFPIGNYEVKVLFWEYEETDNEQCYSKVLHWPTVMNDNYSVNPTIDFVQKKGVRTQLVNISDVIIEVTH